MLFRSKLSPEADAFFTIINLTTRAERLVGVVSPGGEACLCQFHPGLNPYTEKLKFIEIPAFQAVKLRPGDYYIRLNDSGEELRPGRTLTLSLRFQNTGAMDVSAPVTNQLLGNLARPKAPR